VTANASTAAPPTVWVHSIGRRAGLGSVHPDMLRAAFIMAALDAGVPLRDVQLAARHADPRTTTIYDHRRQNFDRHAAYVVVAFVAFVAFVAGG
jgi:integrase/recombinase XerD